MVAVPFVVAKLTVMLVFVEPIRTTLSTTLLLASGMLSALCVNWKPATTSRILTVRLEFNSTSVGSALLNCTLKVWFPSGSPLPTLVTFTVATVSPGLNVIVPLAAT